MYNRGIPIDFIFLTDKIVVLFLLMTIPKKSPESVIKSSLEVDDDYYAVAKQRIAEETQKAHKIHEVEMESHLTALIPYYDEAEGDDRRRLLLLNRLLVSRFEEPGMMYWNIFRNAPAEIEEYADLFWADLSESDKKSIIDFLHYKKEEEANMVDMWFDGDGEEDDLNPTHDELGEIGNGRDTDDTDIIDNEEE